MKQLAIIKNKGPFVYRLYTVHIITYVVIVANSQWSKINFKLFLAEKRVGFRQGCGVGVGVGSRESESVAILGLGSRSRSRSRNYLKMRSRSRSRSRAYLEMRSRSWSRSRIFFQVRSWSRSRSRAYLFEMGFFNCWTCLYVPISRIRSIIFL